MVRLVLLLCLLGGSGSAQTPDDLVWPDRMACDNGAMGVVYDYDIPVADWFGTTLPSNRTGAVLPDSNAIELFVSETGTDADPIEYEQRSAHIVGLRRTREGETRDGYRYCVFVSGSQEPDGGTRIRRTWFRFRAPHDGAKGVVFVMPGMLGTPHEFVDMFERGLLTEGWGVVRMLVPPSRTTEQFDITVDVEQDPAEAVRPIAKELDDRTAECAYAIEAAVGWLKTAAPELAGTPRAIIGMSGTGMMLPTVLARNPDIFDAAIAIAGGANAFAILRESNYADLLDSVRVAWTPSPPSRAQLESLDESYLGEAGLDAFSTAPLVNDTPVLLIHGSRDRAVPASGGDLLWERLGSPERWTTPVGHELVFLRATLQIGDMIDWIEGRTDADEGDQQEDASP